MDGYLRFTFSLLNIVITYIAHRHIAAANNMRHWRCDIAAIYMAIGSTIKSQVVILAYAACTDAWETSESGICCINCRLVVIPISNCPVDWRLAKDYLCIQSACKHSHLHVYRDSQVCNHSYAKRELCDPSVDPSEHRRSGVLPSPEQRSGRDSRGCMYQ